LGHFISAADILGWGSHLSLPTRGIESQNSAKDLALGDFPIGVSLIFIGSGVQLLVVPRKQAIYNLRVRIVWII